MKNLKAELEDRGFLHQYTDEKVFELFENWWKNFYFWVDLSANSMTVGNFVALMMAIHFMLKWNKCYLLVWWATSTIWNPSWKDQERPILSEEQLEINKNWIASQFNKLTENIEKISGKKLEYEIVNNYDFFKDMNILDFLKEVWRFMTINWMLTKDIVRTRIEDPKKWISYAEFSYMLIMWYDFYHLNKEKDVILEVGWSDEWDGILSWIELTWKKTWKTVYWVTNKLITDSNGKKFGKSEWNAIWLDKEKSSPYEVYQFFINTLDEDVWKYLRLFTFLENTEIDEIVKKHLKSPEERIGQKLLAYKVVEIIHWINEADLALKISDFMFGASDRLEVLKWLNDTEIETFLKAMWWFKYNWENLFEAIVSSWLSKSNSEARQAVQSWAININEQKISDFHYDFSSDFINNKVLLLRKGKKNFRLIIL